MKHKYAHINRDDVEIQAMNIHSHEQGIYLVEIDYNDEKGFVANDMGELIQYHSVEEVKDAFNLCRVKEAFLVHQSAYDEMIGASDKSDNTLMVPVKLH
ncbi:DUF6482 family protein [Algicola sagamiensis]|uniref:DUF6482 family protein n=1 Tax=Algicola sagamiensis TaxID=163869 RepID=UPI00036546AA|nr:DUF6482 family protein [Algicola sagamiensis]